MSRENNIAILLNGSKGCGETTFSLNIAEKVYASSITGQGEFRKEILSITDLPKQKDIKGHVFVVDSERNKTPIIGYEVLKDYDDFIFLYVNHKKASLCRSAFYRDLNYAKWLFDKSKFIITHSLNNPFSTFIKELGYESKLREFPMVIYNKDREIEPLDDVLRENWLYTMGRYATWKQWHSFFKLPEISNEYDKYIGEGFAATIEAKCCIDKLQLFEKGWVRELSTNDNLRNKAISENNKIILGPYNEKTDYKSRLKKARLFYFDCELDRHTYNNFIENSGFGSLYLGTKIYLPETYLEQWPECMLWNTWTIEKQRSYCFKKYSLEKFEEICY